MIRCGQSPRWASWIILPRVRLLFGQSDPDEDEEKDDAPGNTTHHAEGSAMSDQVVSNYYSCVLSFFLTVDTFKWSRLRTRRTARNAPIGQTRHVLLPNRTFSLKFRHLAFGTKSNSLWIGGNLWKVWSGSWNWPLPHPTAPFDSTSCFLGRSTLSLISSFVTKHKIARTFRTSCLSAVSALFLGSRKSFIICKCFCVSRCFLAESVCFPVILNIPLTCPGILTVWANYCFPESTQWLSRCEQLFKSKSYALLFLRPEIF